MIWLLANWKKILLGIALVILVSIIAFTWSTIAGWKADSKQLSICTTSLQAQIDAAIKQKEQADDYFKQLDGVNRELARVKRVRPTKCICPKTSATGSCAARTGADDQLHRAHGVTSDALYDFAADAERVRQQLLSCQRWVRE